MKKHIERHKDGSVLAKGVLIKNKQEGYWEWFRKNGVKMRSGYFKSGKQIGEWITYDAKGFPHRVTFLDKKNANEIKKYYASVPKSSIKQLNALRKLVMQTLKSSDEVLNYGVPHIRFKGQPIVAVAGFKDHVSIFPLGGRIVTLFEKELKPYKTSKGTIQFALDKELPKTLIQKIVKSKQKSVYEDYFQK